MLKKFPGTPGSYWIHSTSETNFSKLENNLKVDVVVVGGGVAGINAAFSLKQSGKNVVLIEADHIIKDVTAASTAKISAHTVYSIQIAKLGEEKTRLYAQANRDAVETVACRVSDFNIDCDFRRVSCYFYSESEEDYTLFKAEEEIASKLGFSAYFTTKVPTSSKAKAGMVYENQAEFHPRKYLMHLAEKIQGDGSYIFENTRFLDIRGEKPYEILTDQGSIKTDNVVIASHFPVYDPDNLYLHLKPTRTFVMAYHDKKPFPDAMFVCINPFHTYRSTPAEKGRLIIIAGEHQAVGEKNTLKHYKSLETYIMDNWNVDSIDYYWMNQDNSTSDGLPLIGETSKKGIYLVAGFGGWGMTHGTTAGNIITDLINGKENPLKEIFDPLRFKKMNFTENNTEKIQALQRFREDKISWDDDLEIKDLGLGQSKIIRDTFVVFKDKNGKLHKLQGLCTHKGCLLSWNDAEETWDCPCHGARFNYQGKVIHGPAVFDLKNYS